MNILYTITCYPPSIGGAQLHLHEITKRMAKSHKVNVISFFDRNRNDWLLGTTLKTIEKENRYNLEGVNVRQIYFTKKEKLKMLPYISTYYFNKRYNIGHLASFLEKKMNPDGEKIDLIHNVRVGREPLSYASYNLAKRLGIPFFFTPLHHPRWSHWFFKEYQHLYRKANGLFALTEYERKLYIEMGVKKENIFVTGIGPVLAKEANPRAFTEQHNLSGNVILFIGQGFKYKGIALLLKAAKIVLKRLENVNFVIIGPPTNYSKGLLEKERDKRIVDLSYVDLQTKTDALAACDIFCLPSTQESFGGVFLEAWSFEKPVVGIDIPQLRSFIEDGVNGFLVQPAPQNIAEKIIALLENPKLRESLGKSGKMKADMDYSWDKLYQKTIVSYNEVLSRFK